MENVALFSVIKKIHLGEGGGIASLEHCILFPKSKQESFRVFFGKLKIFASYMQMFMILRIHNNEKL